LVLVVVIRSSGDRVLWGLAMLVCCQARLQLNTPPAHFVFAQRVSCEGGDTAVQPVLTSYRWPSLPSTTPQREKYRETPRVVDSSTRLPFPADTTSQAAVSTLAQQPVRCADAASEEPGSRWRSIVIAAMVSTFREIEISQSQFQKPQCGRCVETAIAALCRGSAVAGSVTVRTPPHQ
jgi:hypothetical protein